jgi:hypothetical protein
MRVVESSLGLRERFFFNIWILNKKNIDLYSLISETIDITKTTTNYDIRLTWEVKYFQML